MVQTSFKGIHVYATIGGGASELVILSAYICKYNYIGGGGVGYKYI